MAQNLPLAPMRLSRRRLALRPLAGASGLYRQGTARATVALAVGAVDLTLGAFL